MSSNVERWRALQVYTTTPKSWHPKWWYVGDSELRDSYVPRFGVNLTNDVQKIKDFSENEPALISLLNSISSKLQKGEKVEAVIVTRTTKIKVSPPDNDLTLEDRRKAALAKLSPIEVEALGLENHAVYCKLKFHNAENRDE